LLRNHCVAEEITEEANQEPVEDPPPPKLCIALDAEVKAAAAATMNEGIAAVRFHEAAALRGEVEPLHQMRVASRRLRAAVEVFAGVLHGARVNAYRRDLRWLGQVAGAVRDCDMTAELVKRQAESIDPSMAVALEPLYQRLLAMRGEAQQALAAMTKSRRYRILIGRLMNPLPRRARPALNVVEYAPLMIGPLADKVRKAGKHLAMDAPPDVFHTLRKRIKRLRYAFEMLSAGSGPHHRQAIVRLEELQESLGQHHDAVALGQWLRHLPDQSEALPAATMMAAGAMVQELARHEAKLKTQSLKGWKQFKRDGVIKAALKGITDESDRRKRARIAAQPLHDGAGAASANGVNDALPPAVDSPPTGTEDAA
jgi:CHAD domain-containing protein